MWVSNAAANACAPGLIAGLTAVLVIAVGIGGCGDDGSGTGAADAGFDVSTGEPAPGEDGAPCTSGADCFSGSCLTELEFGMPSGYCTAFGCDENSCNGGFCFASGDQAACLDECNDESDCRAGYACLELSGRRFCDFDGTPEVEVGESSDGECTYGCESGSPVRIDCGYTPSRQLEGRIFQYGLPYELAVGIDGFTLAVWALDDNDAINIVSARNNSDDLLALKGADSALNVNSFVENELAATVVPFAPNYEFFVEADRPSGLIQVQTRAQALCLLRSQGLEGDELTLHVYLVGNGSGLREDTLDIDPDFTRMIDEVDRLLGTAGVSIGDVVPHTVDESITTAYRILRESDDLRDVLAITENPAEAANVQPNAALALNLVLVDDIQYDDGSDTIGQTGNLPGPAGLHGTGYSGVAAELASFRDDPEYLGLIVAHEIGHFLGLRHTTEVFTDEFAFGRTDPLDDTRECPDVVALLDGCPDYHNLMFPLAPAVRDASRLALSEDQGWVLRRNPLIR